jgi:hypothetical protein
MVFNYYHYMQMNTWWENRSSILYDAYEEALRMFEFCCCFVETNHLDFVRYEHPQVDYGQAHTYIQHTCLTVIGRRTNIVIHYLRSSDHKFDTILEVAQVVVHWMLNIANPAGPRPGWKQAPIGKGLSSTQRCTGLVKLSNTYQRFRKKLIGILQ